MTLRLYAHPLSSYCWKALVALHETGTPFEFEMVDFGDPESVARFMKVWPMGQMPVLVDEAQGRTIPESSIVIEYIDDGRLVPRDADAAREVRLWDRFYDLSVQTPMQTVVFNRIRPADSRDPYGVERAIGRLRQAYDVAEAAMDGRTWAAGEAFSMADCAAAPALHYGAKVSPFADTHPRLAAYLLRLEARPSFARVLEAAQPYAHMFPQEP